MWSHKYIFVIATSVLVIAGFGGCASKQVKSDQGAIKSAMPSKALENAPTASSQGNELAKRQLAEAPPGPKEQPEPVGASRAEKSLQDIFFDLDRYDVRPTDEKILNKDYLWVKYKKPGVVIIEGNCDERGTVEYNLALGERRAEAAKKYLVALGVDQSKLKTISYGKSKPVDPGHNEEAWAKNRRDHFVVQ